MTTHWHPDTCDCRFDVADDWLSAVAVKVCEHHAEAPDPFNAVRNENAFKNIAVGHVRDLIPAYSGNFSYGTGADALTLHLPADTTDEDRARVQSALDEHFGPGIAVG